MLLISDTVKNLYKSTNDSSVVKDYKIVINGTTYQVNSDGKFSLIYTFSKDDEIYYYTNGKENENV